MSDGDKTLWVLGIFAINVGIAVLLGWLINRRFPDDGRRLIGIFEPKDLEAIKYLADTRGLGIVDAVNTAVREAMDE